MASTAEALQMQITPGDLAALGDLAGPCAQALQAAQPTLGEIQRARSWIALLNDEALEMLSIDGECHRSGYAEQMFAEYCASLSDWAQEQRASSPVLMMDPDVMAGCVVEAMRLAGDDDPAAADWLWSPVGLPLRGNSGRLTGTHRHTVHLTMLASQSEQFAGIDIQATLKAAEKDTRDLIDMSVQSLEPLGATRNAALHVQDRRLIAASAQTPDEMLAAEKATRAVFEATVSSWQQIMLASAGESDCPVDAYGWAALLMRRLADWQTWIGMVIDQACAAPDMTSGERLAWWMSADLMMRAAAYEGICGDDTEAAADLLANELLGRLFDLRSA